MEFLRRLGALFLRRDNRAAPPSPQGTSGFPTERYTPLVQNLSRTPPPRAADVQQYFTGLGVEPRLFVAKRERNARRAITFLVIGMAMLVFVTSLLVISPRFYRPSFDARPNEAIVTQVSTALPPIYDTATATIDSSPTPDGATPNPSSTATPQAGTATPQAVSTTGPVAVGTKSAVPTVTTVPTTIAVSTAVPTAQPTTAPTATAAPTPTDVPTATPVATATPDPHAASARVTFTSTAVALNVPSTFTACNNCALNANGGTVNAYYHPIDEMFYGYTWAAPVVNGIHYLPQDCKLWDNKGAFVKSQALNQGQADANQGAGDWILYTHSQWNTGNPNDLPACFDLYNKQYYNPSAAIVGPNWTQGIDSTAQCFSWRRGDATTLQILRLQNAVPAGYVFDAASAQVAAPSLVGGVDTTNWRADFQAPASGRAVYNWSDTSGLASGIAGLSVADATAKLQGMTGITPGSVSIQSAGLLPLNPGAIQFTVNTP